MVPTNKVISEIQDQYSIIDQAIDILMLTGRILVTWFKPPMQMWSLVKSKIVLYYVW